jgi:hypothetical protein
MEIEWPNMRAQYSDVIPIKISGSGGIEPLGYDPNPPGTHRFPLVLIELRRMFDSNQWRRIVVGDKVGVNRSLAGKRTTHRRELGGSLMRVRGFRFFLARNRRPPITKSCCGAGVGRASLLQR